MTRDEFLTQFNELTTADTLDHSALAAFRQSVLSDYDELATTKTTLANTQETINNLNADVTKLKEANMRLFMMSPASVLSGGSGSSVIESPVIPETPPPTNVEDGLTSVIDALIGNTSK